MNPWEGVRIGRDRLAGQMVEDKVRRRPCRVSDHHLPAVVSITSPRNTATRASAGRAPRRVSTPSIAACSYATHSLERMRFIGIPVVPLV